MELRDFIVTPIVIMLVYVVAYFVRPYCTDAINRVYFIPALTVKMIGAIALGIIYQFYYTGGDTFSYHTHGSRVIWDAFMDSPTEGVRIYFSQGTYGPGLWEIADKIWFWRDPRSFFVIQIATIFDLITFSTYSATAVLFSVLAFVGGWMLYLVFYKSHSHAHFALAFCCLFVPSVLFWGSGILKDTITLAFAGICTFCFYKLLVERKRTLGYFFLLVLSFYMVYSIKKYILICLIMSFVVWVASRFFFQIRSYMLRIVLVPIVIIASLVITYFSIKKVTEDDARYSIENLAQTSKITAYDIRYGWGARTGDGSGYNLGELDGSWLSMFKLAPGAINVSLFRPYLWEVENPLMALSALESLITLLATILVLIQVRSYLFYYVRSEVIFCLVFALIFAFGVGVSSYNFGTLSRYKIPLLPFYWSALAIIYSSCQKDKREASTFRELE
ncbi:MAG: hypothetical protein HOP30_01785 [Cyclobacteriaceae bacterium]|nr:hypothetical protein [Cyclobacteriaceae bacterium]